MYRLQVNVQINVGEAIAVIGSIPELGEWQVNRSILLQTDNQRYPQWWTEIAIDHSQIKDSKIEYKYLRIKANGAIQWERGSKNRWIPNQSEVGKIIIDDGWFDCIPSYPYGYLESPPLQEVSTPEGKKILVLGSSVALGCSAWLLRGWSWYLQQELKQRYGYQLINRSIIGANVNTIIARFNELVGKDKPWAIIIALSLGNEGFAYCAPQERKNLQQHFENGLKQLIKMITDMGACPILGGVYPHGEYQLEHYLILEETRKNMLSWGVPVLDWLPAIHDGMGRWQKDLNFDVAHPNSKGHQLMYQAIAPEIFANPQPPKFIPSPPKSKTIFADGPLKIIQESDILLAIINESTHEYNVHPMWKEASKALQKVTPGVYEDPYDPDTSFRTLLIGAHGLESRVKIPPKSLVYFQYQCPLAQRKRTAIISLGDRCAVRMALYKIGLDGPAFPFDLTRTSNLFEVADIIANNFEDMWNSNLLYYNPVDRRVYHHRWWGLSFGHEVEDTDNPLVDMKPIWERMRTRYQARAARFQYTIDHSDEIIFVRTGGVTAEAVKLLMNQLEIKCQGKPFRLLLIFPGEFPEIKNLPNVWHYPIEFNPDRMYADLEHWRYCAEVFETILKSLGVSSKNLFWCTPQIPQGCGVVVH